MNLKELEQRLIKEKIKPIVYNFTGRWENDNLCLTKRDEKWEVYYSERGNQYDIKTFLSEEDACEYFYEWIIKDSSVKKHRDEFMESYGDGRFQIFLGYRGGLILFDVKKRRVLGENCKYLFKDNILYISEAKGYIVINLLDGVIKQMKEISQKESEKFTWGGEYGEEYVKIDKFEEFSKEEQNTLKSLSEKDIGDGSFV